jgi:hypothetical protein
MRIFVMSDARGQIQSVAIPNSQLASAVNVEGDAGVHVHALDVDSRVVTRKALLEPKSGEALAQIYGRLGSMIEAAEAKASAKRASKPARRHR